MVDFSRPIKELGLALLNKARKVSHAVDPIMRKDCEKCGGAGQLQCRTCHGTGTETAQVTEPGTCKNCNGTGTISQACPQCGGEGTLNRQLRHEVEQAEAQTSGLLIFLPPFTETVSIHLRNIDDRAGYFTVGAYTDYAPKTVKSERIYLRAGERGLVRVLLRVDRNFAYPSHYVITPETVPYTCPACNSSKQMIVKCAMCDGSGKLNETKSVSVPCHTCKGLKSVKCEVCGGSGKVLRLS